MVRGHSGTPARVCAVTNAVQHLCSGDEGVLQRFSEDDTILETTWYFSTKEVGADRTRHCWIGCGGR